MNFRSMFSNPVERTGVDLSRKYATQYQLVRPFSKDEKGKFINESPFNRLIELGKVDIEESIQSYYDSTNFSKLIERYVLSGYDPRIVDVRVGQYADISNIPDNLNEFNAYFDSLKMENLSPELQRAILSDDSAQLDNAINAEINLLMRKHGYSPDSSKSNDTKSNEGGKE